MAIDARDLVKNILLPRYENLLREHERHIDPSLKTDAAPETLTGLMDSVRVEYERRYTPEEIKRLATMTGVSVAEWNARQMNNQINRVVDLDVFGGEQWLSGQIEGFAQLNVNKIESIPEIYFNEIENLALEGLNNGVTVDDLADEIERRYEVSDSKAIFIARDQVGKLQGQLTKLRQTDLGIDKYRWRTAGDGRVRDSHRLNDGKVFLWSDPPSTGHPGEDYQCRCYAEPVLDDILEEEDN